MPESTNEKPVLDFIKEALKKEKEGKKRQVVANEGQEEQLSTLEEIDTFEAEDDLGGEGQVVDERQRRPIIASGERSSFYIVDKNAEEFPGLEERDPFELEDQKIIDVLKGKLADLLNIPVKGAEWGLSQIAMLGEAVDKFLKDNWPTLEKKWGKTKEERRRKTLGLVIVGVILLTTGVAAYNYLSGEDNLADLIDEADDNLDEGKSELNFAKYKESAQFSWEKYRIEGPSGAGMLDPFRIDDIETGLVTGYIPGWFCIPERISICEDMLGIDLQSSDLPKEDRLPPEKEDHSRYFLEMQRDWDEKWLPLLLKNPNLSDDIKDFYKPENRKELRDWFRNEFPINSGSLSKWDRNVADEMFIKLLAAGKLVPEKLHILKYSHLLASFIGSVYLAEGGRLDFQMTDKGFVEEAAGPDLKSDLLPDELRKAYEKMEEITKKENYTLADLEEPMKVINKHIEEEEKSRELREKSLGRL